MLWSKLRLIVYFENCHKNVWSKLRLPVYFENSQKIVWSKRGLLSILNENSEIFVVITVAYCLF